MVGCVGEVICVRNIQAICFLLLPVRFLISVICIFILVFSASKMAIYLLILPFCLLISVIRAFILVFSASEMVIYLLILPIYLFISVIRAFIRAIAARPTSTPMASKQPQPVKMSVCRLDRLIAIAMGIANLLKSALFRQEKRAICTCSSRKQLNRGSISTLISQLSDDFQKRDF